MCLHLTINPAEFAVDGKQDGWGPWRRDKEFRESAQDRSTPYTERANRSSSTFHEFSHANSSERKFVIAIPTRKVAEAWPHFVLVQTGDIGVPECVVCTRCTYSHNYSLKWKMCPDAWRESSNASGSAFLSDFTFSARRVIRLDGVFPSFLIFYCVSFSCTLILTARLSLMTTCKDHCTLLSRMMCYTVQHNSTRGLEDDKSPR